MRDKGKLVTWNDDKGYGFIAPFSGAAQVFIHVKGFKRRTRRPELNDVVVIVNCAVLTWLSTPGGRAIIE
jgi:cold shock CspA family protein